MTDMTDSFYAPIGLSHCPFKVLESSHRVWSIPPLLLKVGIP